MPPEKNLLQGGVSPLQRTVCRSASLVTKEIGLGHVLTRRERLAIDAFILGLSERDFQDVVNTMVALGLVERIGEPDGVTTTGLRATPSGERYAR